MLISMKKVFCPTILRITWFISLLIPAGSALADIVKPALTACGSSEDANALAGPSAGKDSLEGFYDLPYLLAASWKFK